jgi:N-acetylglucosaminyl-diphospho-decaprenol L-rhamnosyltransferase
MDVSIIIVSYNTAELTLACLKSVFLSRNITFEVFVVDNASHDSTMVKIKNFYPQVNLIPNKENRGFGAANNQALKKCQGRYVVFLNPDTTVEASSIHIMMKYMDSNPRIGLAGPSVKNNDGTSQESVSYRYPGHRYGQRDLGVLPGSIAAVLGACQIISRDLLQKLNGFDEDFFLYGEDQDLCLRVRKQGYEIGFINDASIMHHGAQSEKNTAPEEVVRKKIRAEIIFYKKHYQQDTIQRIYRTQYHRAHWRIFISELLYPISRNKQLASRKIVKYKTIKKEIEAINNVRQ